MNSLLFCTLIGFIVYISSSNASSSSSRRRGYGDITYGREKGERGDNRHLKYGQAIYDGSYGKGREYDDDYIYDNLRTKARGSTRGGSRGSSSSSRGGRTRGGRGSGSGSGSSRGPKSRSRSVSRGRRSNNGRDTRYGRYGGDKGSDKGSDKGYDDGLIASLIQMNVDLYKKIKYLKKEVMTISERRPPFLALNYAICVGEESGTSQTVEGFRRMREVEGVQEKAPCQVGTIVAYSGTEADLEGSNYKLANGDEIDKDDFSALAAILSEKFENDEDCDPCKLPNLTGKFILSVGDIGGDPIDD